MGSLNNKNDVRAFIRTYTIKYKFRGQPQKFLPRSALDTITTRNVIRQVIAQDKKIIPNNHEQEQLVDRVFRNGRKLFATCVDIDKSMKYLVAMLDNGLTDANLPLGEDDFGSLSQKGGFADSFVAAQKRFHTVFLDEYFQELIDDLSDCFSIPIHFEEIEAHLKGKGAFGSVYKVTIHPDQRSFPCETNSENLFAMKITQHEGRELNYHRGMAGQGHPHLVRCLTSFTLGSKYHMVYELANSDLESFIIDNADGSRDPKISESWLAQQFAGIADALQLVHNPETSAQLPSRDMLDIPSNHPERTGYIHDIKPENILVFKKRGDPYLLRLSDFSCARVAEIEATISGKRDSYKTGTKSGTPIYRAPESIANAKMSRPYDMWSLGCVYLEIIVWYLDGFEALRDFRESRNQLQPNGFEDEGFYHQTSSGKVELRQPVMKMIQHVQRRCSGGLKEIADTIPLLLRINPKERLSATQLAQILNHLGASTSTGTRSNLAARPAHSTTLPVRGSLPSRARGRSSETDSDSDFGGMIKVTRPSDG